MKKWIRTISVIAFMCFIYGLLASDIGDPKIPTKEGEVWEFKSLLWVAVCLTGFVGIGWSAGYEFRKNEDNEV